MGLETYVIEQWIDYARKEINEIRQRLEMEKAEEDYQRKQALKNGIHFLANIYTSFLEVLSGKNPPLTKTDLTRFKRVLAQFKGILRPDHWIATKYPSVVPELELAYAGLTNYANARYSRKYRKVA